MGTYLYVLKHLNHLQWFQSINFTTQVVTVITPRKTNHF